jgi:hypothetical protein
MHFVKLNAFQRIMRLWDAVHPYNAAQAFRVVGAPDVNRINEAWRATLSAMGIGRAIVRGNEYCHTALDNGDSRGSLNIATPGTTLDALLTAEMNFVIDPNDCCPFRPFLVNDNGTYVLGAIYHHWVADSASIRWLLHEWFRRIRNPESNGTHRAHIPAEGCWRLFGPHCEKWHLDHAILDLLRYRTRFCRARQCDRPMGDCTSDVSVHYLDGELVPVIAARAKEHGVTVNDVLLATISQVVDRLGANPATRDRDELAVGTVVDLRAMSGRKMNGSFGLFLGFTTTMLRPTDLNSFPRLLRTVARQNAWHKRTRAPQASVLRMGIGLAEAKLVTPRRWAELYRRRMPIATAISNVNMNRDWAGPYHPSEILDYYRATPTGPMIPLIVTPTTLGKKLNFLITRQTSLIDDQRNQQIAGAIISRLTELASDARIWHKE